MSSGVGAAHAAPATAGQTLSPAPSLSGLRPVLVGFLSCEFSTGPSPEDDI